jgi:hypothetical protein
VRELKVVEMDKDVAIRAMVIMVEEVAEAVATTTTTMTMTMTTATNITTHMAHPNKATMTTPTLAEDPMQMLAKKPMQRLTKEQHNAGCHPFDMIGDPPPAGQEAMPGWQGL